MLFLLGLIGFLLMAYGATALICSKVNKSRTAKNTATSTSTGNRYATDTLPLLPALPYGLVSIIVGVILFMLSAFIVKINATEVGIVVTPGGISETPIKTGWHIIAPWNNVYTLNKTAQTYTFAQSIYEGNTSAEDAIWTPTQEGIKLGYDISINWQIVENDAPWIYANIPGSDSDAKVKWIEENVVRSSTKMVMSTVVKDYNVIDAYTQKRDSIQLRVNIGLQKLLAEKHIILFEAGIREVHYNPEYEAAINNKKLAEQEALRLVDVTKQKDELLKQAVIEKDMAIQVAQGEAEALKIKGTSLSTNPKIIQLEWIDKWNGVLPTYILGGSEGLMLNLN